MNDIFQNPLLAPILTPIKHNVFVSFHHEDQWYRNAFDTLFGNYFTSKSVDFGDIDPDNRDAYIKKLIQENHISDSSVVIALYGANTWKRKHVDWEISAGLHQKVGGHSGLIVLVLPTFPVRPYDLYGIYNDSFLHPYFHPRVSANLKSGFASLLFWPGIYPNLPEVPIATAFEDAFNRRTTHKNLIDNSHPQYQYDR